MGMDACIREIVQGQTDECVVMNKRMSRLMPIPTFISTSNLSNFHPHPRVCLFFHVTVHHCVHSSHVLSHFLELYEIPRSLRYPVHLVWGLMLKHTSSRLGKHGTYWQNQHVMRMKEFTPH